MSGVFLSYRRADSAGWADRLADLLGKSFGADALFMDIHAIAPSTSTLERFHVGKSAPLCRGVIESRP